MGTDSHHPWQLEFIDLVLAAAAAAGVARDKILNFKTVHELLDWSRSVRDDKKVWDSLKRQRAGRVSAKVLSDANKEEQGSALESVK